MFSNRNDIQKYPFFKLLDISSTNYKELWLNVNYLQEFVKRKEFYQNVNGCIGYTFDFIITYSNFLLKNSDSDVQSLFMSFLALLQDLIKGIYANTYSIHSNIIYRILAILLKSIESPSQHHRCLAVKVVVDLMERQNILGMAGTASLIVKAKEELSDDILTTLRFWTVVFDRSDIAIDLVPITQFLKQWCSDYLNEKSDPQLLFGLLKCLVSYCKDEKRVSYFVSFIQPFLWHFCTFWSNPLLRNLSEELVAIVVYHLYCTDSLCSNDKSCVLKELQGLPANYKEWPDWDEDVFFVVAYVLYVRSVMPWSSEVMNSALENYVSKNVFLSRFVIKALLLLYPLFTDKVTQNLLKNNLFLFRKLETFKCVSDFLTYDPVQMAWLLRNATLSLKNAILQAYLQHHCDNQEIINVLNISREASLLINIFVRNVGTPIAARACALIKIIKQFKSAPDLQQDVRTVLPLMCSDAVTFSQLLSTQPLLPEDMVEMLSLLKAAAAALPLLTRNKDIEAVCLYSSSLLATLKAEPKAFRAFYHFSSVKFLINTLPRMNESTVLATIRLLRRLIVNQVLNNLQVQEFILLPVDSLFKGGEKRISFVLNLLQVLVTPRRHPLLLSVPKQFYMSLYHQLHSLADRAEYAAMVFHILTRLIESISNLCFSLKTLLMLDRIYKNNFDARSRQFIRNFFEKWYAVVKPLGIVKLSFYQKQCLRDMIDS